MQVHWIFAMTRFMSLLKPMRFLTLPALLFTCALALGPAAHAQTAGVDELRYTVKAGDTLEAVSRRLMEQPRRYPEIARLNGLRDQDALTPGQVLRFPAPYLKMQPGPFGPAQAFVFVMGRSN
jgi:hypothetical protein